MKTHPPDALRENEHPLVSICLPNLNNRPYLEERIQTILDQTWQNWELIIVDNYSEDGAWEYFQTMIDPRIRISQAPKRGMYANWNNCIDLARGEYVYIATSDDTMQPDCIETLVHALQSHPECGIAHSNLIVIDDAGTEIEGFYETKCRSARYFGDLIHRLHIRHAPHDGLLHYYGGTVYVSITQLLIRKNLFDRVGYFRNDLGSCADFEWGMRAGLISNTVHVPLFLASWRIHSNQATSFEVLSSILSRRHHLKITRSVYDSHKQSTDGVRRKLPGFRPAWEAGFTAEILAQILASKRSKVTKVLCCASLMFTHPVSLLRLCMIRLVGRRFNSVNWMRKRMRKLDLDNSITPL